MDLPWIAALVSATRHARSVRMPQFLLPHVCYRGCFVLHSSHGLLLDYFPVSAGQGLSCLILMPWFLPIHVSLSRLFHAKCCFHLSLWPWPSAGTLPRYNEVGSFLFDIDAHLDAAHRDEQKHAQGHQPWQRGATGGVGSQRSRRSAGGQGDSHFVIDATRAGGVARFINHR